MHSKKRSAGKKKIPVRALRRVAIAAVLVLIMLFTSLSTVIANTVSVNVIDGENTYSFDMGSSNIDRIIAKAEEMGLAPIDAALDVYERVGGTTTVIVRRGVDIIVNEAGSSTKLRAYKGDTVEQALEANSILLKEKDEINPAREYIIDKGLSVEINRYCTVTVTADDVKKEVSLTGGKVRDAVIAAGFTVGADDEINYSIDKPLFDQMAIRIARVKNVTIAADGETKAYKVAADTVKEAIIRAGVTLGEHDRVEPKLSSKVTEGLLIDIKRVEIKEEKKVEPVKFETVTEESSDMYTDETKVKTAGVEGEKEVDYKVTYVEGKEEAREVITEKVTKEPVSEVVIRGTKERPSSGGAIVGNGSLTDHNGKTISYRTVHNGTASAYCDTGLTATGYPAGYGYVAVNPNVIPYGSRLYICSPDGSYVYGYAIAADTGGALMSGRILVDLWMESVDACYSFGLQNMNVYVLD